MKVRAPLLAVLGSLLVFCASPSGSAPASSSRARVEAVRAALYAQIEGASPMGIPYSVADDAESGGQIDVATALESAFDWSHVDLGRVGGAAAAILAHAEAQRALLGSAGFVPTRARWSSIAGAHGTCASPLSIVSAQWSVTDQRGGRNAGASESTPICLEDAVIIHHRTYVVPGSAAVLVSRLAFHRAEARLDTELTYVDQTLVSHDYPVGTVTFSEEVRTHE